MEEDAGFLGKCGIMVFRKLPILWSCYDKRLSVVKT